MNAEAIEVAQESPSNVRTVEKVKMQDGREVEFVGKRSLLKETIIDREKGEVAVRLDFRNGETRTFVVPTAMILNFAGHGAGQKLGDETAGVKDIDDAVLGVDELIERLNRGEWTTRREGSGMAGTSVLMKALMEFSNRTAEQVKQFLTGKTQAEKLSLRNSPKIRPIVERIEAEKANKGEKVDTDALLSTL
jgi:hypothetical protein